MTSKEEYLDIAYGGGTFTFKKGELVEVSDNGICWHLRYFSHISSDIEYKYAVYPIGLKSGNKTLTWKYCRKYKTF